jgi:hypothetical protein
MSTIHFFDMIRMFCFGRRFKSQVKVQMPFQKILEVKFDNPEWVIHHQGNDYFTLKGGDVLKSVLKKTGRGGVLQVASPVFTDKIFLIEYTSTTVANEPDLFLTYKEGKLIVGVSLSYLKNGVLNPKYEPFLRKFVANLQDILPNRSGMMEVPYNTKAIDTVTGTQLPEDITNIIGKFIPPAKVPNPLKKLAKGGRRKTRRRNSKKRGNTLKRLRN